MLKYWNTNSHFFPFFPISSHQPYAALGTLTQIYVVLGVIPASKLPSSLCKEGSVNGLKGIAMATRLSKSGCLGYMARHADPHERGGQRSYLGILFKNEK